MSFALLDPKGVTSIAEIQLIKTAVLLMLAVVIPTIILFFTFAWKFRSSNKKAKYEPNHVLKKGQIIFWIIPASVIAILGVIIWQSTHALDPYKPLASSAPQLNIEVVALDWKWLFIYPEQGIATVNYLQFPANTPLHFDLTADAPMSSFWIPQLGPQMYAMPAMVNQLNLMATATGTFVGKDVEINGAGFSGMQFMAHATSQSDFDNWIASVKSGSSTLSTDSYNVLAAPSQNDSPAFYAVVDPNLYNAIIMKYMMPSAGATLQ